MPVVERPAPTVAEIAAKGDKVMLLSYFGRPKLRNAKDTLNPIATALAKHLRHDIALAGDCVGPVARGGDWGYEERRRPGRSSVDQDVIRKKRHIKTVVVFQCQYQHGLTRLSVGRDGCHLSPLLNQRDHVKALCVWFY
jgi:hypothetical protein